MEVLGDSIREFIYEYDFGDSWRHQITVTPIAKPRTDWSYPLCVAGAGAAPPEDVGGVSGYEEFLSAIKDPKHEEHDRMLEWVGGAFDPAGFDLNEINRTLRIGPRPYGKSDARSMTFHQNMGTSASTPKRSEPKWGISLKSSDTVVKSLSTV